MSDTTVVSFVPGFKSSIDVDNGTVVCWLRNYTAKDKYETVDSITWDANVAVEQVKKYLFDYGITQKINDTAAMKKADNPTPRKKHDKRKAMIELLKKGVVKAPKAGKINKEALGIAKGLKMAGLSKEDAQKALANQPDIPTADIEYSINVAFEE